MPTNERSDFEGRRSFTGPSLCPTSKSLDQRLSSSGSVDGVSFYIGEKNRSSSGESSETDTTVFESEINDNTVPVSDENGNRYSNNTVSTTCDNDENNNRNTIGCNEPDSPTEACDGTDNFKPAEQNESSRNETKDDADEVPTDITAQAESCDRANEQNQHNNEDHASLVDHIHTDNCSDIECQNTTGARVNGFDLCASCTDHMCINAQHRYQVAQNRRHLPRRRTISAFESSLETIASRDDDHPDATGSESKFIGDTGARCKPKQSFNARARSVSESDRFGREECNTRMYMCNERRPSVRDCNSRTELLNRGSADSGVHSVFVPCRDTPSVNETSLKVIEQARKSSTEDVTFIHRYDTLVNEFHSLDLECTTLKDSLKSQRKLFYSLVVVTLLLIGVTCVILILTIAIDKDPGRDHGAVGVTTDEMESYVTEKLASKQTCISCTSFRNLDMNHDVTYTVKGNECCVDDFTTLVERLSDLVSHGQSELGRRLSILRGSMQNLVAAWNQPNTTAPTLLLDPSSTENKHERGSIHLIGKVKGSKMFWENQVTSTSLSLESDKVKVTYTANYFLYVKLGFVVPANTTSTIKYTIYQENDRGNMRTLDHVISMAEEEDRDRITESPFHRVVKLNKGDKIFISSESKLYRKAAHMFGMFEI